MPERTASCVAQLIARNQDLRILAIAVIALPDITLVLARSNSTLEAV